MAEPSIAEQLDAVDTAVGLSGDWAAPAIIEEVTTVRDRAGERLGLGLDHTVVALGGPTGAGKSTLFNALVGEEVSTTGVRRPTTGESHAAVWSDDAGPVLDWLDIRRRHRAGPDADRSGLVLVDLPDHDSTSAAHRAEVDRLVELVDLFVWVVDPQKYADLSFHEDYVRPLARHADVMVFVLSKTDLLSRPDIETCVADLRRRVVDDGIPEPTVIAVSVVGGGAEEVRGLVADAIGERRVAVERVRADLRHAVAPLAPPAGGATSVPKRAADAFVDAVGAAAGIDATASAAAAQDRHRAMSAAGWPVLGPIRRWRRPPATEWAPPSRSPVASAEIERGARSLADAVGGGESDAPGDSEPTAGDTWRRTLRDDLSARCPAVLDRLDEVTGEATVSTRPRRWWSAARVVQRLVLAVTGLGAIWVALMVLSDTLLSIDIDSVTPETPGAEWMPLPTAVLLGGLLVGALLGVIAAAFASVGARRVARSTRSTLRRAAAGIATEEVLDPLGDLLERRARVRTVLADAALVERH